MGKGTEFTNRKELRDRRGEARGGTGDKAKVERVELSSFDGLLDIFSRKTLKPALNKLS